jgi:hypothetical protein
MLYILALDCNVFGFSASVYRRTENTIDKEKEIRIRTMIENNTTQKQAKIEKHETQLWLSRSKKYTP